MTQVNVLNAKEKTSGNLPHRCQLAKPGDLQLIKNAEEGRSRFLTDTARDAAKHLIKGSHTYTHAHASKHTKELSGSKYQWWRSFQDLSTGRNGRMGRRRAAEVHAPAAAAAAPGPWDALGPNPPKAGARSPQPAQLQSERQKAPIPAPASAASGTAISVQNLVPQQLRAQDFGSHCACAKARNYDSRGPLASISQSPVLSIGSYLACCAWPQRSGWGARLLNYCCARGLEA